MVALQEKSGIHYLATVNINKNMYQYHLVDHEIFNRELRVSKNVDVLTDLEEKPGECCNCQALSWWYDLR